MTLLVPWKWRRKVNAIYPGDCSRSNFVLYTRIKSGWRAPKNKKRRNAAGSFECFIKPGVFQTLYTRYFLLYSFPPLCTGEFLAFFAPSWCPQCRGIFISVPNEMPEVILRLFNVVDWWYNCDEAVKIFTLYTILTLTFIKVNSKNKFYLWFVSPTFSTVIFFINVNFME